MRFDKAAAGQLRREVTNELKALEARLGISFKIGNIRYSDQLATFQMEARTVDDDGTVITKEAIAFQRHAEGYGLKPTDLGKQFSCEDGEFEIVGLNTRAKRYPICCRQIPTGKGYKFPSYMVCQYLMDCS